MWMDGLCGRTTCCIEICCFAGRLILICLIDVNQVRTTDKWINEKVTLKCYLPPSCTVSKLRSTPHACPEATHRDMWSQQKNKRLRRKCHWWLLSESLCSHGFLHLEIWKLVPPRWSLHLKTKHLADPNDANDSLVMVILFWPETSTVANISRSRQPKSVAASLVCILWPHQMQISPEGHLPELVLRPPPIQ